MMKRSAQVPAALILSMAASLTAGGCSGTRTVRECVDATGKVLPDSACRAGGVRGAHFITRTIRTGGFGSSGSGFSGG